MEYQGTTPVRHVQPFVDESLEHVLERFRAELDSLRQLCQRTVEDGGSHCSLMEPVADATADAPESMAIGVRVGVDGFYQQVEAYCQTQQANLADLQAQVLLQSQTQARNLAQQERLPEQLLTELEALIEAQEQQLRLFQSRRDREQQSQKLGNCLQTKRLKP